jgi:hypothetical protein
MEFLFVEFAAAYFSGLEEASVTDPRHPRKPRFISP